MTSSPIALLVPAIASARLSVVRFNYSLLLNPRLEMILRSLSLLSGQQSEPRTREGTEAETTEREREREERENGVPVQVIWGTCCLEGGRFRDTVLPDLWHKSSRQVIINCAVNQCEEQEKGSRCMERSW